jgi:hypothetical protein
METTLAYTENTLIGLIVSTLIRLSPELFKIWHKYIDNKHELEMVDRSNVTCSNTVEDRSVPTPPVDPVFVDKLIDYWKVPGATKKVDVFNQLVRPNVVYILVGTFVLTKFIWFAFHTNDPLALLWTKDDQMLLSGVLNFFFLNRVFDKR